jgi:hypothetical protein
MYHRLCFIFSLLSRHGWRDIIILTSARSASIEHLLNPHFRPEGLGVICAERSDQHKS